MQELSNVAKTNTQYPFIAALESISDGLMAPRIEGCLLPGSMGLNKLLLGWLVSRSGYSDSSK